MLEIPVDITGLEKRRRSIGLLHIVAGFFLIGNADRVFQTFGESQVVLLVPLFLVSVLSILYGVSRKKLDATWRYNFGLRLIQALTFFSLALAFTTAGAVGKGVGLFLWSIIAGTLAATERITVKEQTVAITDTGFSYPNGYTYKTVAWDVIANVTLRPDFLTIHFSDNRFLQFELKQPLSVDDSAKLQGFCRRHISESAMGRKAV